MVRYLSLIATVLLPLGSVLHSLEPSTVTIKEKPGFHSVTQPTPTPVSNRRTPPPTVYPPLQVDNGAQTYWGMCVECHADDGQGLTDTWRGTFPAEFQNCWQSECHGSDHAENSFEIPAAGVPALSGAGALTRFSHAQDIQSYLLENMPYFPAKSMSGEQAWSLTAFLLERNDREIAGITLNASNGAAIPVHYDVMIPEKNWGGVLLLVGILVLALAGLAVRRNQIRTGSRDSSSRPNFFHHLHPIRIPFAQARFRHTLGAGGLGIFLSLILLITGLLEMYYYVPSIDGAAISVETITTLIPFGYLIRNMHFWAAQALVVVMTIHLLRVVLTGAYSAPRRLNFLIGLGLLVLILLLDFTGYILRWDEGIRWALVVGTNLLKSIPWVGEGLYSFFIGGSEPGVPTITRFFGWHIFGLSLFAGILMIWHAFRVRRDGGIAAPPSSRTQNEGQITRYELVRRELHAAIIALILLLLLSLLAPAPLDQPLSNTANMTADSKAPWFFLWIQQLLRLGDPFLWGIIAPVLIIVLLGLMPYVLPNALDDELGRWFPKGNRIAQVLTTFILFGILVLTLWGALAN